jgi:hypothetical protein
MLLEFFSGQRPVGVNLSCVQDLDRESNARGIRLAFILSELLPDFFRRAFLLSRFALIVASQIQSIVVFLNKIYVSKRRHPKRELCNAFMICDRKITEVNYVHSNQNIDVAQYPLCYANCWNCNSIW